jgi:creatinine amidohydrolase
MQWENLTSSDFAQAVQQCGGVGIIPIGVLEAHASHLPLGTDIFTAHFVACRAAEEEPVIVFPQYPYSINHETAHLPGGLVIKRDLAFALLENVCDEMYRNGLHKIILISGHGGNRAFLPLFVQTLPEKAKPYVVYYADLPVVPEDETIIEHPENGHACEAETSMMRHIDDASSRWIRSRHGRLPTCGATRRSKRRAAIPRWTGIAQYPHMYVGDAHKATPEKGAKLLAYRIRLLVNLIRAVKADAVSPALVAEFNQRQMNPSSPPFWQEPL